MIMKSETERTWKKVIVTYFGVPSWHLTAGSEENRENRLMMFDVLTSN
jgi:hypothetical protein